MHGRYVYRDKQPKFIKEGELGRYVAEKTKL